ncbi:erythrocyte membrane protein 1, PfEMP1, putative [Plasmodium sp. gorilla clade G1]|nr:erythrocyte membrane protein 1, PfEMP1, putative [Plasmodium sp. gorilla clade G1]
MLYFYSVIVTTKLFIQKIYIILIKMTGKRKGTTENKLSARGVLEEIGKKIKDKREKGRKYEGILRGILRNAKFADRLYKESHGDLRPAPSDACSLEYKFHTNITTDSGDGRNPCHGREQNRFSESQEYACSKVYIRGDENNSNGTACAPPRRRHMCDQNLEFLDNSHTDDTHNLLGNVLVTAKYEGESIVTKHPNKTSSDLCTSLARSFADIGDIVRGRDMFRPNDNDAVKKGLKVVFQKIYNKLGQEEKEYYDYGSEDYAKLREDWWDTNRDQVWKAITCQAPENVHYFRKGSNGSDLFSNNGPCGRNETIIPTYLDYVPQFLRWFDEWSEEFCRIKKIKIDKTEEECIGKNKKKDCSREGYYCKETNLKLNEIFMDLKCPNCEKACTSYKEWIENKKKEFKKQKKKYEMEFNGTEGHGNIVNGSYYKAFYDELKDTYKEFRLFEFLNKGQICENVVVKNKIDHNDLEKTFSRSEHCKSCPIFDLKCENGQCISLDDIPCQKIQNILNISTYKIKNPIDINMLVNNNKKKGLFTDLKDNFNDCDFFKTLKRQNWNCKNKCNINVCELQNFEYGIDDEKHMLIEVLINRWLVYFLSDYSKLKEKVRQCINNEKKKELMCIKGCYKKCDCVEKWIKEKRGEWENIQDHYLKPYKVKNEDIADNLKVFLQKELFTNYVKNALDQDEKLDKMKESDGCNEHNKSIGKPCKKKDVITILLNRLEDKMKNCKIKHDDTKKQNSCETLPNISEDDDFDEEDDEDEELHTTKNPCVTGGDDRGGSSGKMKSVRHVAKEMQKQASGRHDDDISKLKANAKLGQYDRGGKGSSLKSECDISLQHSNRHTRRSQQPCAGKDGHKKMFQVVSGWQNGRKVNEKHPDDVFLPPRREHFCTSNLEHLNTNVRGLRGPNAIHSLLGDVLLAANKEAGFIKQRYMNGNSPKGFKDKATICQAIKYSFADMGDIIKGTDLWEANSGEQKTQRNLETIFGKIKNNLGKSVENYKGDSSPYLHLRKDWWEANRDQVWKAMKCKTPSGPIPCSAESGVPFDDYIPQRLRWLTEWAEWFCKMQSQEYNKVQQACTKCSSGVCKSDCDDCKKKCEDYRKFIEKWKKQWDEQEKKYQQLFGKATQNSRGDSKVTRDKDADVVDFLSKLLNKNGTNNVFESATAYVHDTGNFDDCNTQNVFCEKNGSNNYAFREKPYDYEQECTCVNDKSTPKPQEHQKSACKIVEDVFSKHTNMESGINSCNKKEKYPDWDCTTIKVKKNPIGVCIPPRRQKICTRDLTLQNNLKEKKHIRTNFITCAAIETYFAWLKYKEIYTKADKELQEGKIPEGFKRQMYYTFGDYRDIFFGTDISTYNYISDVSQNVITILQRENGTKSDDKKKSDKELLEDWWNVHGKEIWEGMLCTLTNSVKDAEKKNQIKNNYSYDELNKPHSGIKKLNDFSKKRQFLRWYIEWSDQFCKEREEKEKKVVEGCSTAKDYDGCENSKGNVSCAIACEGYQNYISNKKVEYTNQEGNFKDDKTQNKSGYNDTSTKDVPEYLKENCLFGSCSCIEKVKDNPDYWQKPHTTYDDNSLQIKCDCPPPPCEIVDKILGNKSSSSYTDGCKHKYTIRYAGWDCGKSGDKKGEVSESALCIPPRRRRLYVKDLETLTGGETEIELREAFIKCAAIETFFSWHEFKNEKEKEEKEKKEQDVTYVSKDVEEDFQNELKKGEIPQDFKRQMFYTFGDYKDICLGNELRKDVTAVNTIIDKVFENMEGKNGKKRENWWNKNGPAIWDAMVCALSYNTKTKDMIEGVRNKLTNNKYDKLKPNLEDFAAVPQFLRWFDEWGKEFCQKQKIKIDKIKEECRGKNNNKHCSGEGYSCNITEFTNNKIFKNLLCPSCEEECTNYKKWIKNKEKEFNIQKGKHQKEYNDNKSRVATEKGNNNKMLYDKLKKAHKENNSFFELLNNGEICKNDYENNKIDYNNMHKAFLHSEYCESCPIFDLKWNDEKCNSFSAMNCKKIQGIPNIKTHDREEPTVIDILVNYNKNNDISPDLKDAYKDCHVLKRLKKQNWKCKYVCNLDVCELQNFKKDIDDEQYISIEVLIKRWLVYFLSDYSKLKEKLNQCMNNENNTLCIKDCKIFGKCVEQWINDKNNEWQKIKERYLEQYESKNEDVSYHLISYLLQNPFTNYVKNALEKGETLDKLQESDACHNSGSTTKQECKKKDVIIILIDRLKDKINTYNTQFREEQTNCSPLSEDPHTDSDTHHTPIPPGLAPLFCNVPANPCGHKDATNVVNVEVVAKEIQEQRHKEMLDRSVKNGETKSSLEGDINKAKFKNGSKPSEMNNGCEIKKNHSNAIGESTDPCHGKNKDNKMFDMEASWKSGAAVSKKHSNHVFFPPRREHFCISNLEKIDVASVNGNPNTSDSLLVDVLLAAKEQADFIKKGYVLEGFKDDSTKCRAMKYSFADLGDIIKGTDLWVANNGENDTQRKLEQIFGKIKDELGTKYTGDNDSTATTTDPQYLKLRADWWEANRKEIWKEMQCKTSPSYRDKNPCSDKDPTPLDDYIPQRLRWMTEWSEWYCKMQSQAYDNLVKGCDDCMSAKCKSGDIKCTNCTESCNKYREKINLWRQQWDKIKEKYNILYKKAESATNNGDNTSDPKDEKNVVDFLKKLHKANKGNNKIYSTAEGYIHQEAKYVDCKIQTQFCENKNGETSNSAAQVNEKYAFYPEPYDHKQACACDGRNPDVKVLEDPCTIVDEISSTEDATDDIQGCKKKDDETNPYPQWKCGDKILVEDEDVCMPPRREKICLYYLKELNGQTENDLREAFIKTAAAETVYLWEYYHSKNVQDVKLLNSGIIPNQFLRSMFYTFGDYRDICLGTDIPAKTSGADLAEAKKNIGNVFSKNGKIPGYENGLSREGWWKEYGKAIWEGMLCGLSYASNNKDTVKNRLTQNYRYKSVTFSDDPNAPTLSKFAERHPFLRWYIEWSDMFCREQKKEYNKLVEGCRQYECNGKNDENGKKEQCENACELYKNFINNWKPQWTQQSEKYQKLYTLAKQYNTTDTSIDETEKKHLKYLKELKDPSGNSDIYSKAAGYLEKEGYISECMEQNNFSNVDSQRYAFHNYPNDHKTKCECKEKETPPPPSRPGPLPKPKPQKPPQADLPPALKNAMLSSTIMWSVGISFAAISYFLLKKKSKSSVDLLRVLNIPKGDYGMPTLKSKNRYIPYRSGPYKGKTYIYMEGDTSGDEDKYIGDITSSDITSSESEYEEMDINDIYVPGSPKYKTLIEVVLEPSKSNGNIPHSAGEPLNKCESNPLGDMVGTTIFTDEEWNELKQDFISQYIQSRLPMDVTQYDVSTELPMNIVGNILDDGIDEKPFITSIHDRDLYSGEEISYNINMSTNSMDDPKYISNNVYSGIDLINDTLSGNQHIDIYDEVLKRKENELFGTNYKKNTSNNSVAKLTNSDPIMNQLDLLHKWLDRHRDMCEKWNNKEELLDKLNEQWNKDNGVGGDISTSNGNKTLNTDVSIEIDMDETKGKKEFSNMDTILDDMEDDIYYDVNDDEKPSTDDIPMDHNKVDVPKKVHVEMKILNNTSNGSLEPEFPISDVWNI